MDKAGGNPGRTRHTMALRTRFVFARLAKLHFLLLLVPLVAVSALVVHVGRVGTSEAVRNQERQIEHARDLADSLLGRVTAISVQLAFDPMVREALTRSLPGTPGYFRVWRLASRMLSYDISDESIVGVYVFLRESNVGVSAGSAFEDIEFFMENVLRYDGDLPEPWETLLWDGFHSRRYLPAAEVHVAGIRRRVIPFLQSIPLDRRDRPTGVVFILVDELQMLGLLEQAAYEHTSIYVSDSRGSPITRLTRPADQYHLWGTTPPAMDARSDDALVSTARSTNSGWELTAVTPTRMARAAVDRTTTAGALAVASVLLVVGFVVYRLSRGLSRPADDMRHTGFVLHGEADELMGLARRCLVHDRARLESSPRGTVDPASAGLGRLAFPYRRMVVCVCRFENDADGGGVSTTAELKDAILAEFDGGLYCGKLASGKEVFILGFPDDDLRSDARIIEQCRTAMHLVEGRFEDTVVSAFGRVSCGVGDVLHSLEDAMLLILYRHLWPDAPVLEGSLTRARTQDYSYPLDVELSLLAAVTGGHRRRVQETVSLIRRDNLEQRVLTPGAISELITLLRGTLVRCAARLWRSGSVEGVEELEETLDAAGTAAGEKDFEEAFALLEVGCVQACDLAGSVEQAQQNDLTKRLMGFVEQHYHEPDLNLYRVAQSLNLSESVAYRIFRDQIGQSFASYLQTLRVSNACKLLCSSGLAVRSVANQVGYSSDTSFRRSFKRELGLTPAEYREAAGRAVAVEPA